MNRYDHLGRRVQKIAADGAHTFLYDGWRPVVETVARVGGGTDRIEYHWGKDLSGALDGAAGVGGLIYVKRNGAIYVPFGDAIGNVMGYWDEQGAIVAEYAYDAFGRTVAQSGELADVFAIRYSTKYYDAETGMYYYGKRFYLTALCRWLTRDPIMERGGLNLYSFCGNESPFRFDALGKKIFVHIERRMNEDSVPGGVNATGRGTVVVRPNKIHVFCKSCRLQVDGSYTKIMYVLRPDSNLWSDRLSTYDNKWGKNRDNNTERNATIAHENDHWNACAAVEAYIEMLNSREGEFLFFCKTRAQAMQKEVNELISKAKYETESYDEDGKNQGGMSH